MKRFFHLLLRLALFIVLGISAMMLWDRYTPTPPPPTLAPIKGQIDRLLVEKSARRMTAYQDGTPVRVYDIALGFSPTGNKQIEGDGKTPEGIFKINRRNAKSAFHLSLGLNYPLPDDLARAREDGTDPGGDIFIHGQPNGLKRQEKIKRDWTAGCIAVSNTEMEELWAIIPIGTVVEIRP